MVAVVSQVPLACVEGTERHFRGDTALASTALTHEVSAVLGAFIKLQERLLVCAGCSSRMPSIFAENPDKMHKVSHACAKRLFPALKGSFMCLCSEQTASSPLPSSQLHPLTSSTRLLPPNTPTQEGELQKLGGMEKQRDFLPAQRARQQEPQVQRVCVG